MRCQKGRKSSSSPFLAAKLGRKLDVIDTASGSARRAGLHAGAWEVAQDFDEALLDEFWLGRDMSSFSSIRTHSFGGTATDRSYLRWLWLQSHIDLHLHELRFAHPVRVVRAISRCADYFHEI